MSIKITPLIKFLSTPTEVGAWRPEQWQQLIEQSYYTGMLARVYAMLIKRQLFCHVPNEMKWHFESANKVFIAHRDDAVREVEKINNTLGMVGITPVYLKGSAYLLEKLTCSEGRLFSDIDVFVKKEELKAAEEILGWNGWQVKSLDEHDQKYYRDWMHELPPMVNTKTGMTLDLHHHLLPIVSRVSFNSDKLLEIDTENKHSTNTLCNEDKVLHSIIHLLLDGEFNHGFRDIHDIYLMLIEFQQRDDDFQMRLCQRAEALNVSFLLYYSLRLQQAFFSFQVDAFVMKNLESGLPSKTIANRIVNAFTTVLNPDLKVRQNSKYKWASLCLFVRSHWLKMPINILLPHLTYKAFAGVFKKKDEATISL
ncbi:nucleotidyltransferase domain-containing protein [Thalassotalea euphylliae]|uniref:Nucleotidyltransferase family protein n=1 Tax=Thalassotalea euphylliae TaxID=1655234 RepID=A0A3E0UJI5_9GAMM|nr:nucleotidyltransferase family protein [Thalassotalea euphylliae]REL37069.1 hypothetical protein DXX92_18075 [Thalassotalea euphylliae]